MTDDPRLAPYGIYTPEGILTPGYGDHYLFLVGRDDVHGILHYTIPKETLGFKFNMFGYADDELNADVIGLVKNPNVMVQGSLDKIQAGGVHESKILAQDEADDPDFYNSFVILQSATDQISHTKGGIFVAQGISFESSTNWSASGEGTGISLVPGVNSVPGYKAQNNTFVLSTNPVFLARFSARLDTEHLTGLNQQRKRAAKASG